MVELNVIAHMKLWVMKPKRGRKPRGQAERSPLPPLPEKHALVGYARASTEEHELAAQVTELERAGCVRVYREHVSATAKRRPALDAAMELLRPGDVLVVYALDRFARSMPDLIKRLEVIEGKGAGFKVLSQPAIDTTSPLGKLLLAVLGAVAEFELSLIRARTKAALQRRIEAGERFGRERSLSDAQIREAQSLRDKLAVVKIAAKLGVSPSTIRAYTLSKDQRKRLREAGKN